MSKRGLRIAVVANKSWEAEPLVGVLTAKDARPRELDGARRGYDPAEPPPKKKPAEDEATHGHLPVRPRLSVPIGEDALAEVWCIEDWMRKKWTKPNGEVADRSRSSSHEKLKGSLVRIRKAAFGGKPPDLVVAFGTAGIPSLETLNGSVTIGTRVYIHDPWDDAPKDERDAQKARFGPLLRVGRDLPKLDPKTPLQSPRLRPTLFQDVSRDARHAAEARFVPCPIHPARPPRILAGHGFAALSTVNICDYDDYIWADEETLSKFEANVKQREIGSMETTHGLIRLAFENTSFLFVSGIADRVPMFNTEVTPRSYAQNFAAAHNAGVTTAFLVTELARLAAKGGLWSS